MGGRGSATDRASSKFGAASGGGGFNIEGYGKSEQATARKLFGKNMSAEQLANLAGAKPFSGGTVIFGVRDGNLHVEIEHKLISTKADEGMNRLFFRDKNGKLAIYNETFYLKEAARGQGVGTRSIGSQIQAAKGTKAQYIRTFAANPTAWANLGYNRNLSHEERSLWSNSRPFDKKVAPKTVRELYDRGGRGFFSRHGEVGKMTFSLRRGSISLKAYNAYAKEKLSRGKK